MFCGAVMYIERYLAEFPAYNSPDAYNTSPQVVTIKNVSELCQMLPGCNISLAESYYTTMKINIENYGKQNGLVL